MFTTSSAAQSTTKEDRPCRQLSTKFLDNPIYWKCGGSLWLLGHWAWCRQGGSPACHQHTGGLRMETPGQDTAWISQNITQPGAGETFGSNADGAHLESSSFVVVFSSLVLHFIFQTSCGISIKLQQKIRNIAFFTCIFNLLNPRGNFLN